MIAVCAPSFCKVPPLRDSLQSKIPSGYEVRFNEAPYEISGKKLQEFIGTASYAIVGKERIDQKLLSALPLKGISKYGVGEDNIDFLALRNAKVKYFSKPGVNAQSVAEHTLGLMLGLLRKMPFSHVTLSNGGWLKDGGRQFSGCTIGVIGYGHVGSRVSALCRAFGCKIIVCDTDKEKATRASRDGYLVEDIERLLSISDIVSLHTPLNASTRHLIGRSKLEVMKKDSFLINSARGGLVDEKALITMLDEGRLSGAALDVFENEPTPNLRLVKHSRVFGTCHSAGNSIEAVLAMGTAAIDGICQFILNERRNLNLRP